MFGNECAEANLKTLLETRKNSICRQARFLLRVPQKSDGCCDRLLHSNNEVRVMKRIMVVFAMLFATAAFGQDLTEFVKDLKTDIWAGKKEYIKTGMQTFTDEEAKRFWPIYEKYNADLGRIVDARVAVIKAYADEYDTMSDAKASELVTRSINIRKQRAALDEKYRKEFATALSPRRLARFYQIENELDLLIQLQAASQIPKMKWWVEE